MRRALSTLGCPRSTLAGALALAEAHRLDGIELRALEGTTDLPGLFKRQGEGCVRRAQEAHPGVQVMVLATSLRLGHPAEADREAFLACVPWAEAMGVPWLRVFDGLGAAAGNSLSLAAETLSWWRRLRLEKGWKADIIVETHDGLVSAGAIDRFCSLDPGVRLLWDAHATWRATGVAPHALWPGIARHVSHIHVKDSVGRPCGAFPYTYVLPGQGDFPMAPLLQALARDGYSHAVSLEWERHWHPGLPPLEDALAAAAESGWW